VSNLIPETLLAMVEDPGTQGCEGTSFPMYIYIGNIYYIRGYGNSIARPHLPHAKPRLTNPPCIRPTQPPFFTRIEISIRFIGSVRSPHLSHSP
jgi:hypothetical protein